jgi:hypothetical protein
MPKRTVEQVNIYPSKGLWITCAWLIHRDRNSVATTYTKERTPHTSMAEAAKFIEENYVGVSWTGAL